MIKFNFLKFIIFIIIIPKICLANNRHYTLMLDPSGDASEPGRIIDDTYERGLTLQFAQQIKQKLEEMNQDIRVILSRFPGETIEPLQNASFANRLQIDLFISLHFYMQTNKNSPTVCLYYLLYHPIIDFWQHKEISDFEFVPYDEIYKFSLNKSAKAVEIAKNFLKDLDQNTFNSIFSIGCPFKPLLGIKAPAFGIEIGLQNKNSWQNYIEPISLSINKIINELN